MELLTYTNLLRITDAVGRYYKDLGDSLGDGTDSGTFYKKVCEIVSVTVAANTVIRVRARDIINFAIGDTCGYWKVGNKREYTEKLPISAIDRTANDITLTGTFSSAPGTSDYLILFNNKISTVSLELVTYVLAIAQKDQVNNVLAPTMELSEMMKSKNAIHPLLRTIIDAINNQYPAGIDGQLDDEENAVISTPMNITNATVDIPNEYSKVFVSGNDCSFYDTSTGLRSTEHKIITSVGAYNSGTTSETALITFSGVWAVPPASTDILVLYDRLNPYVKLLTDELGIELDSNFVFPPEQTLATYTAINATTGTLTPGTDIDTDIYGDADLEVEALSIIGGNNFVLTMTGQYYTPAGVETDDTGLTVTITATSVIGTRFTVTPGATNRRYHSISAITNSNGTAADSVKIVSKLDRLIRRS